MRNTKSGMARVLRIKQENKKDGDAAEDPSE